MRHPKTFIALSIASVLLVGAIISSCSKDPVSSNQAMSMASLSGGLTSVQSAVGGPPGYEPAYVNDSTVRINAIEVKQNPTQRPKRFL